MTTKQDKSPREKLMESSWGESVKAFMNGDWGDTKEDKGDDEDKDGESDMD